MGLRCSDSEVRIISQERGAAETDGNFTFTTPEVNVPFNILSYP
jgi:hypothetical protein